MNPKDTQEYVTLRAAAMMFLEAEKAYQKAYSMDELFKGKTRLDAARSVLWDVINDKDLTK